tara:strand:- start:731 stop:3961 length:3231 start_codon:yes stop_codon:yes gene_type:complete
MGEIIISTNISMSLIPDLNKVGRTGKKKIRDLFGVNSTKNLIKLANEDGVNLGKRKETQEKRAYKYFGNMYNEIEEEFAIKQQQQKKVLKLKKTKEAKQQIKTNTRILTWKDEAMMLPLFYDIVRELYKKGENINVIKKGGEGEMALDFSFTFTGDLSRDFKEMFISYLQIDSDTDRISHDINYKIYINVGKKIKGKKILQAFKFGTTNCLFTPMIKWCDEKEENAKTKMTAYKYSGMKKKLIKDELLYRESGVSEEDINMISNKYQVNIEVNTPFQKNFITCKSDKKALTTFKFINTRVDHVEHNRIVNLKPEIVSQSELNEIKTSLRGKYHTYTKNNRGVSSISTIDKTYKKDNEYNNYIREFEKERGINNYYLDDMVDVDVSRFVRQGVHFNETIDFKDIQNAKIKNNTSILKYTDEENMLGLFYNRLKGIYKKDVNINVIKKGGDGGIMALDFSFTFTGKLSQDFKKLFLSYIQIDSDTDKLEHDTNYKLYINIGKEITGKKLLQALGVTNNEKKYNHIDMEKAYANFKMCKYFNGFVGKITDYRKTNKIVDVGYYRIENIRFQNATKRLKDYNDVMKIYNNNVYPSPELEFLKANGVEFDIIEGCWGTKFDFEFDEHMLNTKDNDIKYYCKYVGTMFYYSEFNSFFMNCDETLAEHITYSSDYDMVSFNQEEKEVKVSYKKQHNNHLSHVCGFITSYMRMNVLEQLLSIEIDDVIRVCVDGIYLYGDYKTLNCFRDKPELIKQNDPSDSYISNNVCEIAKCKTPFRSHNKKELHKGVGGSGKTHLNINDEGLIRKLFVAPSWKLSRSKNKECGIKNQVWANIISDDPEKINYINQNFNVLIIDEISMMSNETKKKIFYMYPSMKIIMCGDPKYQLPSFTEGTTPFKCVGFDNIIKYDKNRRCKCPDLQQILTFCRDNIELEGLYHIVKPMIKQKISKDNMKQMYKKEDLILCRSNKKKNLYTEMFDEIEKFYILKTDRNYCKGEIVFDKPDDNYKLGVDYEIRHGFTTHSIQGETAKHNLFIDDAHMEATAIYTALSRAEYLKNIYIVNYSDNEDNLQEEEFDVDELYAMM